MAPDPGFLQVLELRQYTLRAGRRDELIDLFEQELLETQEAEGIRVLGTFRDRDDPQRFVWFRAFRDMATRQKSLEAFYGGATWKRHRDAANATMIDSDNVLLLRPARPASGFSTAAHPHDLLPRPFARGTVLVAVAEIDSDATELELVSRFEEVGAPALSSANLQTLGYFVTEPARNTFPALPVRERERVFVCVVGTSEDRHQADAAALVASLGQPDISVLRLEPTARSLISGTSAPCRVIQQSST